MSDITITERQVSDVTILEVSGKITRDPNQDPDSVTEFRKAIRALLGEGKKSIILNLENVGYIDSSGIGELVSSWTATKKEKGNLKLLRLTPKIQDLLAITKLLTVFDTFDHEDHALASYSP